MAGSRVDGEGSCPVCLRELKRGRLGQPDCCSHFFCYTCIFEWAKNVNTCPVDRIKFNHILVYSTHGSRLIEKVYIPDHSLEQEATDFTYCELCRECDREDSLLLCDGCDKGYHMECLSPPLRDIPEGDWFCAGCLAIRQQQGLLEFYGLSDSETIGSESESSLAENGVWETGLLGPEVSRMGLESDHVVLNCGLSGMRSKARSRALETSSEEDDSDIGVPCKRRHKMAVPLLDSDNESDGVEILEELKCTPKKRLTPPSVITVGSSPQDADELNYLGADFNLSSPDFREYFSTVLSSPENSDSGNVNHDPILPSCTKPVKSAKINLTKGTTHLRGKEPALKTRRQLYKSYSPPPPPPPLPRNLSPCADSLRDVVRGSDGVPITSDVFESRSCGQSQDEENKGDVFEAKSDDSPSDDAAIHSGYLSTSSKDSDDESFKPTLVGDHKKLINGSLYSFFPRVGNSSKLGSSATDSTKDRESVRVLRSHDSSAKTGKVDLTSEKKTNRVLRSSGSSSGTLQALPASYEDDSHPAPARDVSRNNSVHSQRSVATSSQRTATPVKRRRRKPLSLSRKRNGNRTRTRVNRKRHRKAPRISYSSSRDFTHSPPRNSPTSFSDRHQFRRRRHRSTARTAASYTPQRNAMRSAVQESYKHKSETEGLESARKVLLQASQCRRESLQQTPFRSSLFNDGSSQSRNIETPQSGYTKPLLKTTAKSPNGVHQSKTTPSIPHKLKRTKNVTDLSIRLENQKHPSLTQATSSTGIRKGDLSQSTISNPGTSVKNHHGGGSNMSSYRSSLSSSRAFNHHPSTSPSASPDSKTSISLETTQSSPRRKPRLSSLTTIPETPPSSRQVGATSTSGGRRVPSPRKTLQLRLKEKGLRGRQLSSVRVTPTKNDPKVNVSAARTDRNFHSCGSEDLLGEIHQSMDDLHCKNTRIERDGRVVPLGPTVRASGRRVDERLNQRIIESPTSDLDWES